MRTKIWSCLAAETKVRVVPERGATLPPSQLLPRYRGVGRRRGR